MTKYSKSSSGKYVIHGSTYETLFGSRAQVWHETAYKTSGGLIKKDLIKNKEGRIVSKSKHNTAKKEKRLIKAGYGTRKGRFGAVKIISARSKKTIKPFTFKKSKKHRGGTVNLPLSPSHYDGKGVGTSGVNLQFVAGNAS